MRRFFKLQAIIIISLCSILFAGCASPESQLFKFKQAVNDKNWNVVWDMMSSDEKTKFEEDNYAPFKENLKNLKTDRLTPDLTKADAEKMSCKDFFIYGMKQGDQNITTSSNFEIQSIGKKGGVVTISLEGDPRVYVLKREKGAWKISIK